MQDRGNGGGRWDQLVGGKESGMAVMRMKDSNKGIMDNGKYIRYTPEQVEALERVYNDCPKPSSIRRQQLLREYPILANIEPRQIKVWFQNRRCREKQRKETSRLQSVNASLTAMNKIIMEENERLSKHSSQLALENQYLRQQLTQQASSDRDQKSSRRYSDQATALAAADRSPDSEVTGGLPQHVTTTPQHPRDSSPAGLLVIAEETLTEFLSKATGTAVDWIQMPGMKPGPDSIGTAAITHGGAGVAARAWGLVGLEPTKVAEILKDRPCWLRDCRRLEILRAFPTPNGGTIELIYTQMYAPTTLAPARDLWTLRYTTYLEDGNLVVCERSLSNTNGGPAMKNAAEFVRADMLPSGYLIRPYEGGVCSIHIVDHLDLEPWRVLEVLRPLYESSAVLAQKMTLGALRYLRRISQETAGENLLRSGQQPAALRALSQRLARGFNEAVNGFADDGWTSLVNDGVDDVTIAINMTPTPSHVGGQLGTDRLCSIGGGILCAKASMLLQNVPPATLIRFLREHRSEWADCSIAADAALRASSYNLALSRGGICVGQIPLPLIHSSEEEEFLEVIKLEGHGTQAGPILPRETVLLQLCSGSDDNAVGACAQLVFAPVDAAVSDDVPLLPSGFRVIPLVNGLQDGYGGLSRTLDLASTLEGGEGSRFADDAAATSNIRSVLTMAFQFVFEPLNREEVAASARQYVRNVMVSVQSVAMALASFRLGPRLGPRNVEALILAHQILRSYRVNFGLDLTESDPGSTDAFWHHKDAIVCCTWKAIPEFIFANRAGLEMLETTWSDLHAISWDKTLDEAGKKNSFNDVAQVIQQGFAYLQGGIRLSTKGRPAAYERAVAWKVLDEDENAQCIAYMFMNWSFLG